ncbi:MAG: dihydroneopterin aldolase [Armatimonadota bacterium]|nr:dihydroneopterin aldolase [Armatimonadota bacterium]MDR5697335.1 dihydroneopterin aldolase [Armatimonadota bacterium]
MDRIVLRDMAFYGHHGALPEERERGQVFFVDLEVSCDLREAGTTDALSATIDYRDLYERVQAVVTGPPLCLLEAVAERIAAQVMAIGAVCAVHVEVRKPHADVGGALAYAAVRIERTRQPQIGESLV